MEYKFIVNNNCTFHLKYFLDSINIIFFLLILEILTMLLFY